MPNVKRILLLSVISIVILALVLTGCNKKPSATPAETQSTALTTTSTVPPPSPTPELSARELADASMAQLKTITTVQVDVDLGVTIEVTGGEDPGKMVAAMKGGASVDAPARKLAMTANVSLEMPEQGKMELPLAVYMADGWVYTRIAMPFMPQQWYKMKVTEEEWKEQSQISEITAFLKSAVRADLQGSETVRGIDCYVLTLTPDLNVISNWLREKIADEQWGVDLNQIDLAKMIKTAQVKEWIAKDSKRPLRQQVAALIEISPADFGETDGAPDRVTINLSGAADYSNYDQPVTIVIPPEAQNAEEMTPDSFENPFNSGM